MINDFRLSPFFGFYLVGQIKQFEEPCTTACPAHRFNVSQKTVWCYAKTDIVLKISLYLSSYKNPTNWFILVNKLV